MLHPNFFTTSLWETPGIDGKKRDLFKDPIRFPDRFDQVKEWVRDGGHFHMNGGWYSFSGQKGTGGWGRSRLACVLPVTCLGGDRPCDDLIESTEGYEVRISLPDHALVKGMDLKEMPPLLGFNEVIPKSGADVILEVHDPCQDRWHPLLVQWTFGKGRVTCFMTTPTPHWGINFQRWSRYNEFWQNVFAAQEA